MANESIRIRTTPGSDKNIRVKIDQDFDFLEVLSLKITQEDIYQPFCADYGVVVGRVIANKGFGVPNAKVSIFIPITSEDEKNLLIKNLYPYKSPYQKNSQGVRYNLLLSKQTCELNTPVGTFPSKEEVLDNETMLEVFDKYYKYTTKTNDSGDYMIFGVPVGQHTIHMDVDVSDIGALSVRPYDLISEGIPEKMFKSKTQFKSSTNLDVLPQIKTGNKGVDVIPFWGDAETCEIGITRVDFDTNLQISSTALFFGSIFTDSGKMSINQGCNPNNRQGEQNRLKTGPGVIKMVRVKEYDIDDWVNTNSITPKGLELFDIDGGDLIDDNGVFAFPLPMNVGHVITDEFGNLIPSKDPNVGIPTKGLYRFKMNFIDSNQSSKVRTAHMLFPSFGRDFGGSEGAVNGGTQGGTEDQRFTTDLDAYRDFEKDFHLFEFKQLYTIAHFIKKYKKGINRFSFLGIKNTDVSDESNPFPFTNAIWKFDQLYYLIAGVIDTIALLLTILSIVISICIGFCFKLSFTLNPLCVPLTKKRSICIPSSPRTIQILPKTCFQICLFKWLGNLIGRIKLPCETYPSGYVYVHLNDCSEDYCSTDPCANKMINAGFTPENPLNTQCVKDILDWACCAKLSLAEERNVIRRVFNDAWVFGTAYLFQFKYKKKFNQLAKSLNLSQEKFCGPGSDTINGDNYKWNRCCIDSGSSNNCDRCLVRGPGKTKGRPYDGISNYHEVWHNSAVTGANDIDDVIYCNALMSTKIVSLGRVEMCEETLEQIENSIKASQALYKYVQEPLFYTGTFNENGWDIGYWVEYLKETSYEDPREVLDHLAKKNTCILTSMFDPTPGCHSWEMVDYEFFYMKEVSKLYNDIITTPKNKGTDNENYVFEPSNTPLANLDKIDIDGGEEYDSGFGVDLDLANRFSPCGSNGNCNPNGNWLPSWVGNNDNYSNNQNSFDGITNSSSRNNVNTRSNIPYYYFGINQGKTAITKLRKEFFFKT